MKEKNMIKKESEMEREGGRERKSCLVESSLKLKAVNLLKLVMVMCDTEKCASYPLLGKNPHFSDRLCIKFF